MTWLRASQDLTGQVAVVTGGGGLLGSAFAGALAAAGANVYSLDISSASLKQRIEQYGDADKIHVQPVCVDITNELDVEREIAAIASASGPPTILVNSAAVDPKFETDDSTSRSWGAFTSYPVEAWRRSLDVNLTGTFLTTRSVCRFMEETGRGTIVNVSSTYGLVGPDQRIYADTERPGPQQFFKPVDYSTTKAGVLGFTRALAAYYAGTNIRVNALTPGGTRNNNPDDFVRRYSSRTISRRMAVPADYVGAIVFLCSEASSYMTGSNLVVDGGWTAL